MSRRPCLLIDVVISGGQVFLQPGEPVPDTMEVECTRVRLDFRTRRVTLPKDELSFEDVRTLWKAIEFYGG